MMDRYDETSNSFFDMLARTEYRELREEFLAMCRECTVRIASEAAHRPDVGVGQWHGGRISICDDWTRGVEDALARAKGKAKPDAQGGFAFPPI